MKRTSLGWAAAAAFLVLGSSARGAVQTKDIDYKAGDTALHGMLAWDDAAKGKRPGVLVVHEWWGHNEHARNAAKKLAEAGYVAFALDMYGKGKVATHPKDAEAFMTEASKDSAVVKARFDAAKVLLTKDPHVDASRIGAIGYCFGGGVVLGMARAGEDLKAVGTFHGLSVGDAKKGSIKPALLVQSGADDPMIPADRIAAFKKEMDGAGASYQVVLYPGAKHSFTNPGADKVGMDGLAYNADADRKSWAELLKFFKEKLG
jgi:dienelactone hydrolase